MVPPDLQRSDEEMARVKETFSRIHNLHHQHICPVHLLGEDKDYGYFLVMDYIDGQTLSAYRASYVARLGAFPPEEVVRVLAPVAEALDYSHRHKVIHRDVKPQNIMVVGEADDVQVVDFGLAAQIRTSMTRVSRVRMDTSGTYPYMAPEQWRGEYQDARTDQYALAVVAYELLSGHLPFDTPDAEVMRLAVLNEPPRALEGLPEHVNRTLVRAMAKRREERFGNCREFVEAIEHGAASAPAPDVIKEIKAEIVEPIKPEVRKEPEPEVEPQVKPEVEPQIRPQPEPVARTPVAPTYEPLELAEASGISGGMEDRAALPAQSSAPPADAATREAEIQRDIVGALEAACRQGNTKSYLRKVYAHRLPLWRDAAQAGVAAGQWLLGRCYQDGLGVPRQPAEAFRWYQKAAEQGYAPAENSLGICYSRGDGTRRDPTQAVRYYLQAARRNYASAQYNLGICYEVGRERAMFQDRREAVRWFREAAKQQYAPAQNHLGYCYSQGLGVPHDLAEAVRWYRKAAEQGFARAQHNLGICYQTGRGVTRDLVEAQKWFRQAAEQGVRAPSGQKAPQEQDESRDPSSFWSELLDFFKEA